MSEAHECLVVVDDRPQHRLAALFEGGAGALEVLDGLIEAAQHRAQPRHRQLRRGHIELASAGVGERQGAR
jgi:hypothetical protein